MQMWAPRSGWAGPDESVIVSRAFTGRERQERKKSKKDNVGNCSKRVFNKVNLTTT